MSLKTFIDAYVTCALWSSIGDDDRPLDDDYDRHDISDDAMQAIEQDCKAFYTAHYAAWSTQNLWSDEQAGHDFWLTRNGHGAGFWDRYYGESNKHAAALGRFLTERAKEYGSCDIYSGDDGLLYV